MAKYNIYAVKYGIDPDTKEPVYDLKCRTWDECKKYINGVVDARYKGFLTDSEADAWLGLTITNGIVDSVKHKSVDEDFVMTCQRLGLSVIETEHVIKKAFIDTVTYLENNDCIK